MNPISEDLYEKLISNKAKNIRKNWSNLPFSQSQCGKLVTSNLGLIENKSNKNT